MVGRGEAVGVIAAQSIGEPGTQLNDAYIPHRWCGIKSFCRKQRSVKTDGSIKTYITAKFVRNLTIKLSLSSRSTEFTIIDDQGREKERYKVPYGAT